MMCWKLLRCVTVCAAIATSQAACARVSPASFCAVYVPVYTAQGDTEETRRQADANNAVWLALCAREETLTAMARQMPP